jgi:two-component system, sensor histidine kinase YcbA
MKEKIILYILLIVLIPIAGEFKFYPMEPMIRISLGTPLFFFILLWSKKINSIYGGLFVGISVVVFRVSLDVLIWEPYIITDLWSLHAPVFFYYTTYGFLFYILRINTFYHAPFIIGLLGVICEVASSIMEILIRDFYINQVISLNSLFLIHAIAIIRSFFVLGFFNILILRESKRAEDEQRKRNEHMLLLISNLYVEMIQLTKSMKNTEELTRNSYDLYRILKEEQSPLSSTVLNIAGKIHEIKKDHQRIHSGLTKLMVNGTVDDFMPISDILNVVVRSNTSYVELLKKKIKFKVHIEGNHPPYQTYLLLSIINNLVSNAVEAIERTGKITITAETKEENLYISVVDTGPGIAEKHKNLIFQPGFTTKFDLAGIASNGIGLPYVKGVISEMGGSIKLLNTKNSTGTTFLIELPIVSMKVSENL